MSAFNLSEGAAFLNSLIWETHGWSHNPAVDKFPFPKGDKIKVPRPKYISEKGQLFFKNARDPKVQVARQYPLGQLSKPVVVERLKKRYAESNRLAILQSLAIPTSVLRPKEILFRDKAVKFEQDDSPGIPSSYLDLCHFDDDEFDSRTPKEWMALGKYHSVRKAIPGMAFLPHKYRKHNKIIFDWQDVAVLEYCAKSKLYLVRRIEDCPKEGIEEITLTTLEEAEVGPFIDIWVPRIYLTFLAEDPHLFAQRLLSAVNYRKKIEESLRFSFYVDCMPIDGLPCLDSAFIDRIVAMACNSCPEYLTLGWVKETLPQHVKEFQLIYHKTLNSQLYQEVTSVRPCLVNENLSHSSKNNISTNKVKFNFQENLSNFLNKTYWSRKEVVEALHVVQKQILILLDMPLYKVPLPHILPIDEFVVIQRSTLREVTEFIHSTWLSNVTEGIKDKLRKCGKGYYNLMEVDWYVYEHSKLKKLLTTVSFMMQDTTRSLVTGSLKKYTELIKEACYNVMDLTEDFEWQEGFNSKARAPLKAPIFQIDAVLKGKHLEFANDLQKYHDLVIDLFEEALATTINIPHPEKYVMEHMLIAEQLILETVDRRETEISDWLQDVVLGMDKAILAMKAYAKSYDEALSCLALDQITYVKNCERQKKKYDELKELIEYHIREKKSLSDTIPDSVDIGPFRLVTRSVKLTAVKKHETLADALLEYFSSKLHTHMEDINQKFINLQEQIKQPAGNIENLLEQEKWLETVPNDIKDLSISVKQLREDYKQLAGFHFGFSDDEFTLYWEIVGLPYVTELIMHKRIENLDNEKEYLRTLLLQDQSKLKQKIEELQEHISSFEDYSDVEKCSLFQNNIRKTRKEVENCSELASRYNMREGLFEIPETNYNQISVLSDDMKPFELLWYSIAEFYKWRERDTSEMDIEIDEELLKSSIEESYEKLCSCVGMFDNPSIKKIIILVKADMEQYRKSRFGID